MLLALILALILAFTPIANKQDKIIEIFLQKKDASFCFVVKSS